MIVTTPEKWDVVTRKATGDVQLSQIVRLLIIDEIHLLHEDRGAVIESLVARTLRQVRLRNKKINENVWPLCIWPIICSFDWPFWIMVGQTQLGQT